MKIIKKMAMLGFIFICWNYFGISSEARLIKSGTEIIDKTSSEVYFKINDPGIIVLELEVSLNSLNAKKQSDAVNVALKNTESNLTIEDDTLKLENGTPFILWTSYFYTKDILSKGSYVYRLKSLGKNELKVRYFLHSYSSLAKAVSMPERLRLKTNEYKSIKLKTSPEKSFLILENITSSNRKIADVFFQKGGIGIYPKKAGTCVISLKLPNGKKYTCKLKVKDPAPDIANKEMHMYKGTVFKNQVLYTSKKAAWTSSNPKIATVNSSGVIKAKNTGSCIITAKIGETIYECTIKVLLDEPNYLSELVGYNVKENYFKVKFKNFSSKSLKISSQYAYSEHSDDKSYNRNLRFRGNKDVTIAPHATKTLRFAVDGADTYPKVASHSVYYYINFEGIEYKAATWTKGSILWIGSQSFNTYLAG